MLPNFFHTQHLTITQEKIRRHLMRACKKQGFGWKRWNSEWLYGILKLYKDYRIIRAVKTKA